MMICCKQGKQSKATLSLVRIYTGWGGMALALGKVTILVGAGIIGSVLIKDGGLPSVSDLFSGAFKIAVKQIRRDDSSRSPSSSKPQNDSLLAQVNSLRKELELLESNGSVTIISASRSGRGTYAAPAVVMIVVGYGYIWWKGWKLSDMMFATRRSLSDACTSVAKQLDQVYSSVNATKRHLSSRIDRVDCNIDECAELTSSTRDEVSQLQGDLGKFLLDVKSVRHTVLTLEEKFGEIEKKQEVTTSGVRVLVDFVLENGDTRAFIKESPSTSSRPALEASLTPVLRSVSLPPKIVELEPASPSSSTESPKVLPRLRGTASLASGLKDVIQVTSSTDEAISSSEIPSTGTRPVDDTKSESSLQVPVGLVGGFPASVHLFYPELTVPLAPSSCKLVM